MRKEYLIRVGYLILVSLKDLPILKEKQLQLLLMLARLWSSKTDAYLPKALFKIHF